MSGSILVAFFFNISKTGFLIKVTPWVPQVEQELCTLPEHITSSPVFGEVRVVLLNL
jgi:hypothetical protein